MPRPKLGRAFLFFLVAAFIFAVNNATFLGLNAKVFADNLRHQATYAAAGFAVVLFAVSLLGPAQLQKPYLILVLLLSAGASYYQDSLGVRIDREMIQNAFNSTPREAGHFITIGLLAKLAFAGLLPSLLVLWVELRPARLWRQLLAWAATWIGALLLFCGLIATDFKAYYAVIRSHHELEASLQPSASIGALFSFGKMMAATASIEAQPLGLDAKPGPQLAAAQKPVLLVLVIGESARAKSFGLAGYPRPTTPELARHQAVFFDTLACGTSTAVAVPCMMSHLPQADYSFEAGRASENLLDVLAHAGFQVTWLDNNTGDYDVAARQSFTSLTASTDPVACGKGECNDSIFLAPLRKVLASATQNTVLVLHQVGSHGPPYYLRYPQGFEPFKPACQSSELADCTDAEIINAYDNSIAYTDAVLGQIIDLLQGQTRLLTTLVYQSDHGESLGEGGIYLHSAPYFIAPEEQLHAATLLWTAPDFQTQLGIAQSCLSAKAGTQISHDNLFHTVLGLLNIETTVRNPALDLTADCRP